jgi:hypothetical protein
MALARRVPSVEGLGSRKRNSLIIKSKGKVLYQFDNVARNYYYYRMVALPNES